MSFLRFIGDLITVSVWGLAGNWIGEQLHRLSTGEPGHQIKLLQTGPDGEVVIAANPLITNLVPAVLVGLAIKPRWLWALAAGVITGGLMGERHENALFELIERDRD